MKYIGIKSTVQGVQYLYMVGVSLLVILSLQIPSRSRIARVFSRKHHWSKAKHRTKP